MLSKISVGLAAAVCALALPVPSSAAAKAAPVSYVFFSTIGTNYTKGPNHVYALAVSADGSMTQVGSVSAPAPIFHLSVTKKFLFGIDKATNIYTYSISSTGALKLVATTHAGKYVSGFDAQFSNEALQVDGTGSTVYCLIPVNRTGDPSQTEYRVASFKIESNGDLQFLGTSYADPNAGSQIRFVQNNQFALIDGCYNTAAGASFVTDSNDINDIVTYKRESNGFLTYTGISHDTPTAKSPYEYCAGTNASDPSNHLAINFGVFNPPGDDVAPGSPIGTYTVNSKGEPSTTSDYENMPNTGVMYPYWMSIDPTGKLLVIGGDTEFQLFHFNGASPVTRYSAVMDQNEGVKAFGWDKSSHLFLLSSNSVDIYNITPKSYAKLKSWQIPNQGTTSTAYNMIVRTE
jgi:hypothetical protein